MTTLRRITRLSRQGYTLLEVLIALSILATAMTALAGGIGVSSKQALFSYDLTTATQLARSKMIDMEYEVIKEQYPNKELRYSGTFKDNAYKGFTWEAKIEQVEIPDEAREELLGKINQQLFGSGDAQGALQGNAAFSSALPLLVSQVPNIINRVGQKIRRITIRVEFPYGRTTHPVVLEQYVVDQSNGQFELFGANAEETQ